MKKIFLLCSLALLALSAQAQRRNNVIWNYIERYKHIAIQHERLYGIPASITMAQGILESNAGQSGLARKANNHFGIKAGSSWGKRPTCPAKDDEFKNGKLIDSQFRAYPSVEASYEDHAKLLLDPKGYYRPCFNYPVSNYRAWAYMLKKCGYASAPNYAESLINYIETYQLYNLTGGGLIPPGAYTPTQQGTRITYTIVKKEVIRYDTIYYEVTETIDVDETVEQIQLNEKFVEEMVEQEDPPYWKGPINGLGCTILYPGQTLDDIVEKYHISKMQLLEFNEVNGEDQIKTGDTVFLEKKRKRYRDSQEQYRVREGENLHDVSQIFGVRMASLAKINGITLETQLKEDDILWVK